LFFLLSEMLPEAYRITSRSALTRFFVGAPGSCACESAEYQPARWLVRLIDGQMRDRVAERYPGVAELPWPAVIECLKEHIAARLRRECNEADNASLLKKSRGHSR
jgi:hypothetical protein